MPAKPSTPPIRPYSEKVRAAIALQKQMTDRFVDAPWPGRIRYVGGADIAFARSSDGSRTGSVGAPAIGIAIVWDLLEGRLVDASYVRAVVEFPYVPGLLSFREAPLLEAAIRALRMGCGGGREGREVGGGVDVWMFDGQGRSHPRGVGLATHMGLQLDVPSIGAAKSVLIGHYEMPAALQKHLARPAAGRGSKARAPTFPLVAPVFHKEVEIARALWMVPRTEPMIISQGYRCTLDQALATTVAATLPGRWMPEPTRLADELTKRTRDLPEAEARALVLAQIPT